MRVRHALSSAITTRSGSWAAGQGARRADAPVFRRTLAAHFDETYRSGAPCPFVNLPNTSTPLGRSITAEKGRIVWVKAPYSRAGLHSPSGTDGGACVMLDLHCPQPTLATRPTSSARLSVLHAIG